MPSRLLAHHQSSTAGLLPLPPIQMGPSGSGKTTLLDLLAGRKTVGRTEGHLSFGGLQPTKQFLRRYTGYVEQFDTLLGDLTVREMFMYTAELKRPMEEPLADKRREVGGGGYFDGDVEPLGCLRL